MSKTRNTGAPRNTEFDGVVWFYRPELSWSKPDEANPLLVKNFNCYFFTAKEGFATKLWPKKVNLVKNPSLTVNK